MAVVRPKLTIKQQAIQQVNAANRVGTNAANTAAAKATQTAKAQAQQALGFQNALADINQGDAGRIYDAYANAANKVSAYGDLALASAGDSARSAEQQAQNYLGSVGPDVGAETRPDIAGALRALGATGVYDPAAALRSEGAFAQERQQSVRDAQLMRLADIGNQAMYQGTQTANQLRADEVARQAAARQTDVNTTVANLREQARLTDDQRMKDQAFTIELQQKRVDLAAAKLANATGRIAKKKAQFDYDHAQQVLDASLAQTKAQTAATVAGTKRTNIENAAAKAKKGQALTPYEQSQLRIAAHDEAAQMYNPPVQGKGLTAKAPPRVPYQQALNILQNKYGQTKEQAVNTLNDYYQPGLDGRPAFDFRERTQLQKMGFSKAQIQRAMSAFALAAQKKKFDPAARALYVKMQERLG